MIPIFETVLVDDGRIRLRARHLERLARCGASPAQVTAVDACFTDALLLTDPPFLLRVDVDDEGVRPSSVRLAQARQNAAIVGRMTRQGMGRAWR